jgi:N-hydroxyarylamine O-acetyltransferase
MNESIDLDAYLARIGYKGPRDPTLETLKALHVLHPRAIAFENLDVLLKRPLKLDIASIQRKLVTERRGGYCFEHNGLLMAALQALGFDVTGYAARVLWMAPPEGVYPRTHMLLNVLLPEGRYLADVGFGGLTATAPLRFEVGAEQDTGRGLFRLLADGDYFQVQGMLPEGWTPMYRFDETPQHRVDYELANWFVSTHESSPFVGNLMSSWVADDARYGLFNNQLSIHSAHGTEKRTLGAAELAALMHDTFGVSRPDGVEAVYARLCA